MSKKAYKNERMVTVCIDGSLQYRMVCHNLSVKSILDRAVRSNVALAHGTEYGKITIISNKKKDIIEVSFNFNYVSHDDITYSDAELVLKVPTEDPAFDAQLLESKCGDITEVL